MFCKKCGSELNINDETCPKCGTLINDEFATEKYDPLLALDKVENIEDDVIWQEAPLGDDAIILNAENIENSDEPLIKQQNSNMQYGEVLTQKTETVENIKESSVQESRAVKSTIANPIKPRKRIKPKESPKQDKNPEVTENKDVVVDNSVTEKPVETAVTDEPLYEETVQSTVDSDIIDENIVVEEVPIEEPVTEETVEDEIIVTEDMSNSFASDDVIDIFDDFVVDDSFAIIDETPEIIEEEVTESVDEESISEENTIDEISEVQEEPVVEEPVVEEPIVEESVLEEVISVDEVPAEEIVEDTAEDVVSDVVEEPVVEESISVKDTVEDNDVEDIITPEEALFEEHFFEGESPADSLTNTIETPIMEEVQTKLEEIAKTEEKTKNLEEVVFDKTSDSKDLSDVTLAGAAVAGAADRAKTKVEDTVIKSLDDTTLDKDNINKIDAQDSALKSKLNASFDEDEGILDVDENIDSLTSKITTVLIILLILIIAIVVATFLLQQIGL